MTIPSEFMQALEVLHARLKQADFRWGITGSLGMALQGMDLPIHDIDLQCDTEGAYAIEALFHDLMTLPVAHQEAERIRSELGAMQVGGIKVEIMGGIENREPGGDWLPSAGFAKAVRWIDFQGMRLPVLDLEYEYLAYQRMGRAEKAARIRGYLDSR
jgi:hypothetical protein